MSDAYLHERVPCGDELSSASQAAEVKLTNVGQWVGSSGPCSRRCAPGRGSIAHGGQQKCLFMARIEPLVCALRLTARASAPPDATGGRAATSSTGMLVGGWACDQQDGEGERKGEEKRKKEKSGKLSWTRYDEKKKEADSVSHFSAERIFGFWGGKNAQYFGLALARQPPVRERPCGWPKR